MTKIKFCMEQLGKIYSQQVLWMQKKDRNQGLFAIWKKISNA